MRYRLLAVLLLSTSVYAQVGVESFGFCDEKVRWPSKQVGGAVVRLLPNEVVDPSLEGEVLDVAGTIDVRPSKGMAVKVMLLLQQDGAWFAGPQETAVSPQLLAWPALGAASFSNLGSGPKNPVFGCGAKPMRVGFATIGGGKVVVLEWCMTIRTRCCLLPPKERGAPPRTLGRSCCDEPLAQNADGSYALPADADTDEKPDVESVDENVGFVDELYPDYDTSLDVWYPQQPCDSYVGGTVPDSATHPELPPNSDETRDVVADVEQILAQEAAQDPPDFADMPAFSGDWVLSSTPFRPPDGGNRVFGGRDIVFVHGLEGAHILDRLSGKDPRAEAKWKYVGLQKAWDVNPEYYRDGYFKQIAETRWSDHIAHFLPNVRNRYLVVAYNCNERMEKAVEAVLRQIADAMQTGEGVVAPKDVGTANFGTPSMIVIDYSTGGPLVSIAMTVAATHKNLKVGFIPRHVKAVIAAQGVFSGSRHATAALSFSAGINETPPNACDLAREGLKSLLPDDLDADIPQNCSFFKELRSSILADLVPLVMQTRWALYIHLNPVRTLTVAAAHPTFNHAAKWLLLPGYDDGVSNVNSQIANPNAVFLWPSGFAMYSKHARAFDLPLALPDGEVTIKIGGFELKYQSIMRNSPLRATGYFADQILDKSLGPWSPWIAPTTVVAGGPIPWLSPTGLRQPVDGLFPPSAPGPPFALGYGSLQRTPNHFSFLFSAADHYWGIDGKPYKATEGEPNDEETRALTDPAVFLPYPMPYPGDDDALLQLDHLPRVGEVRRGIRIKYRLKASKRWRERWILYRRYYLLEGWETKTQFDYVYGSVLRD